jgi:hypothetical protein
LAKTSAHNNLTNDLLAGSLELLTFGTLSALASNNQQGVTSVSGNACHWSLRSVVVYTQNSCLGHLCIQNIQGDAADQQTRWRETKAELCLDGPKISVRKHRHTSNRAKSTPTLTFCHGYPWRGAAAGAAEHLSISSGW